VRHGLLEKDAAFLQKPFMADALLRRVEEVLGSGPAPASAAAAATSAAAE
jgi:hypothetical protein